MSWSDSDDDILCALVNSTVPKPTSKKTDVTAVGTTIKKTSSWVTSSFDDFDDFGVNIDCSVSKSKGKARKRTRTKCDGDVDGQISLKREAEESSGDLWADKHTPLKVEELAVHKKKISEVQDWLNNSFRQHQAPILLLTGPAGAGKTACIRTVAAEMKCEVQEWINPVTDAYKEFLPSSDYIGNYDGLGAPRSESQAKSFQDFLLRANKYPTLSIFNQDQLFRKLILVEEVPNVFFRDAPQFHEILRHYEKRGHSPLVFIISDSAANDSNERLLFPKHVQAELNISNISFNPVAQTSLTKVLSRIANLEASKVHNKKTFSVPDKATIEQLAMSSNGDVRGAINSLQFACLKGSNLNKTKSHSSQISKTKSKLRDKYRAKSVKKSGASKKTDRKQSSSSEPAAIGGKDTSLFLFRALGKILYCKRDNPANCGAAVPVLPSHLSHHYRDPLLVNPEDVVEKSHLSSEFFISYLHQNYPEFYNSIDDVVAASDYLSDADYLTIDWASRATLKDYSSSVACRGLMFSNTSRATHGGSTGSKLGWKPLHKPQWFDVSKQMRSNQSCGKSLFAGDCTPVELHTVLVPFLSVINAPLSNPAKSVYVREVGCMPRYTRSRAERLDEKDLTLLDSEDQVGIEPSTSHLPHTSSTGQHNTQLVQLDKPEEDFVIDDFDD